MQSFVPKLGQGTQPIYDVCNTVDEYLTEPFFRPPILPLFCYISYMTMIENLIMDFILLSRVEDVTFMQHITIIIQSRQSVYIWLSLISGHICIVYLKGQPGSLRLWKCLRNPLTYMDM